jgi:hypothetical protein
VGAFAAALAVVVVVAPPATWALAGWAPSRTLNSVSTHEELARNKEGFRRILISGSKGLLMVERLS